MRFFTTIEEIRSCPELLAYIRVVERAWHEFGLSGVLCVDHVPVLYQKEVSRPLPPAELNALHRRFWNQGVATTLVVADPKTVRIFSGLVKPQHDDAPLAQSPALVGTLPRVAFAQQQQSFHQAIATGDYYRRDGHADQFRSDGCVDRYLVKQLVAFRDQLVHATPPLPREMAHSLIGRILFVCYLVDREIVHLPETEGPKLLDAFRNRSALDAINVLYDRFAKFKTTFNGSMFDQDLDAERAQIRPAHIELLKTFLGGAVHPSQATLGFWAYDFKFIPVETISSIYEEFLAAEDAKAKHDNGAFYTPRFLAEMTLDVAVEGRTDWAALRYLDPCCGSGIFLVTLFNRLATRWLLDHPDADYQAKADALLDMLRRQVRGMDVNVTACRLACFSLYLSLLDALSPADIKQYIAVKRKLPILLKMAGRKTGGPNFIPAVVCDDFLHTKELPEHGFDLAVGNPPWKGRGTKQIAQEIVEHLDQFLAEPGEGCLLLPSKLFLNNRTNAFQSRWLRTHCLHRVVQLADFSFILFEHALCPCMVMRYAKGLPAETRDLTVIYDTPKFSVSGRQHGQITITAADRKFISYGELVHAVDNGAAFQLWKRWLWGTPRDQRLLDFLDTLPKLEMLAGAPRERKRWAKGQGFQPNTSGKSDTPQKPWWHQADLFLHARAPGLDSCLLLFPADCEPVGTRFKMLHRPRDRRLYQAPMVLVSQGFGKVAFSNFDILFQDSLQSISGPPEDEDLLLFLAVFLRSRLANYVAFHTAANWGTERDKVNLEELLRLPFPLPTDAPAKDAAKIIQTVASRMRREKIAQEALWRACQANCRDMLGQVDEKAAKHEWLAERKTRSLALQAEMEPLIYRYFGLLEPEIAVVEDTINIAIPSSTPSPVKAQQFDLPTLQPLTGPGKVPGYQRGLAAYADMLTSTLNGWARERKSAFQLRATGGVDPDSGLALVSLTLGQKEGDFISKNLTGKLAKQFAQAYDACARENTTLRHERELLWFEGEHIHLLRPAVLAHWTRTTALNDADRIYGEISLARRQRHA
ncbi:MAG: N-6 DNA methylase [Lentisphaeria bacterium]